ncbi:Lrp/AsnC ligand binding domain-containing protein [Halobacteriovorax sp. HLS]|uniref:Lrp/AsnC ligand binding domain-containing protein n=1 Tax=Halobacteriovorax sp. HLS TaxID=2234000 RepID=UPI000FD89C36|nr:Lrp/AsnC ligand binding domain-containing protein [Halobacteriovorax sp. HLS]
MGSEYEIDSLDKRIISELQSDARKPFLDMARKCLVSGGTIHQRVEKLRENGVIKGSSISVNHKKLGYGVEVLLGIHLVNAKVVSKVIKKLEKFPEVVQALYTTGNYALFIKVITKDIDGYHDFLVKKLQAIEEIRSTESFICLETPINRELKLD